jgi:hypothetical protein
VGASKEILFMLESRGTRQLAEVTITEIRLLWLCCFAVPKEKEKYQIVVNNETAFA